MRILVNLIRIQIRALGALAQRRRQSRAAVIRAAIDDLLAKEKNPQTVNAFGLWADLASDGLAYQEKLRSEW